MPGYHRGRGSTVAGEYDCFFTLNAGNLPPAFVYSDLMARLFCKGV
jgi:hypothetical protein